MTNQRLNRKQRHIIKRIIVKGTLILDTPTCLGSGDNDGLTDMILIRDSISDKALLTGSSIAGALRNYVNEYENGYGQNESKTGLSTLLFGAIRTDDDGDQSPIIIYDAISSKVPQIELRDGVKIDNETGTAVNKAKYDLELLAAETEFPLCFELVISKDKDKTKTEFIQYYNRLIQALIISLQGLENQEIYLGTKKRRGFGRCHVEKWEVWQFDLQNKQDRLAWLTWGRDWREFYNTTPQVGKIKDILQPNIETLDKRDRFILNAKFSLESSLLIRSGQASTDLAPDVVHLKSNRNGKLEPILSGTSLAGVLRHRAERIVNTLNKPLSIVKDLFGDVNEQTKEAKSSRLIVNESVIKNVTELVQNRIAIDRFTGGAYHGALFDEQPVWAKSDTEIEINLELRNPKDSEVGLLLLLLKDLWTSDLPVGGESSIGRGRLKGKIAKITRAKAEKWTIEQDDNKLRFSGSDKQILEDYVTAFKEDNHE